MGGRFVLTDYVESAIERSKFTKLDDNTYAGTIPGCPGVVSFGTDFISCKDELRLTLEDWVLVGLKLRSYVARGCWDQPESHSNS